MSDGGLRDQEPRKTLAKGVVVRHEKCMAQIGKGDMQYALYTLCSHRHAGVKPVQGRNENLHKNIIYHENIKVSEYCMNLNITPTTFIAQT